jgi:hypothetical protein
MYWSSKQGYSPLIPIVLLVMALGFVIEGWGDLYLYAGMILIVLDLGRYLILRRWEGNTDSIAETSDERAVAIAHRAGQQAFWLVMLALWLWLGAGRSITIDPRKGVFGVFLLGLVAYVTIELTERRKVK